MRCETYDVFVQLTGLDDDTTLASLATALDAIDGLAAHITQEGRLALSATSDELQFAFADDTSGVLAALGINTFFAGTTAVDIALQSVVRDDPQLLALSRGGVGADSLNGERLAGLLTTPLDSSGQTSLAQRYEQIKQQRKMLGDGYWFVDSKDSLEAQWPRILAQKPGIISIYLLDAATNGGKEGKGLSPEMAKLVLKKAKKAGLPVYAHVETAEDLRLALKLGVAGITNIPGHAWDGQGDSTKYTLTDEDLKKLAKKKTVVIPQLSQVQALSGGAVPATVGARQAATLKRLFDNGVNVAIGSNDPQRTVRGELNYWFQLGNLNYPMALKTLCESTPRAIYPKRKIGRIDEGYEASFLVLPDNPLNNILKLRAIVFKVKNGVVLKS